MIIRRLDPQDAEQISALFRRVYGQSYANETFYDLDILRQRMNEGVLHCVGADHDGTLMAHMAMTRRLPSSTPELGNTVVDPEARGDGLAWKVGAELMAWCQAFGHEGYVHFPTTDHHIMQRRSVVKGFETGLMLGYIPAETDGKVGSDSKRARSAATIVYEPFGVPVKRTIQCPTRYQTLVQLVAASWREVRSAEPIDPQPTSEVEFLDFDRRGLQRLNVQQIGLEFEFRLSSFSAVCQQIDFSLDDPAIEFGVELAWRLGFRFCGWLPDFAAGDVLRLQRIDPGTFDLNPALENPTAKMLLVEVLGES